MDSSAQTSPIATFPPRTPVLSELFADTAADGAATGFVLAHLAPGQRVLWVQDRMTRREAGRPYARGIAGMLGGPIDVLLLEVARAPDLLWAMEQALGCTDLKAVVGEVWGDPPALTFTTTKRLALRAERSGVQAWLLRRAAHPNLSAARERWRLASMISPPFPDDDRAPGEALWRASLFRSRQGTPGDWMAWRDPESGIVELRLARGQDAALADNALDQSRRQIASSRA